MKDYIDRITELRIDNDIKQKTIADLIGIKQGHYSEIENKKKKLTIEQLMTLCHFYKKTPNYILGWPET